MKKNFGRSLFVLSLAVLLPATARTQTTTWSGDRIFEGNVTVGTSGTARNLAVTGSSSFAGGNASIGSNGDLWVNSIQGGVSGTNYGIPCFFRIPTGQYDDAMNSAFFGGADGGVAFVSGGGAISGIQAAQPFEVNQDLYLQPYGNSVVIGPVDLIDPSDLNTTTLLIGPRPDTYPAATLSLQVDSGNKAIVEYNAADNDGVLGFVVYNSGYPQYNPPGFYHMVISKSGNVGIGLDAPTAKLEVNGDAKISGDVTFTKRQGDVSMGAFGNPE